MPLDVGPVMRLRINEQEPLASLGSPLLSILCVSEAKSRVSAANGIHLSACIQLI